MSGIKKEVFGENSCIVLGGDQVWKTEDVKVVGTMKTGCLLSRDTDGALTQWDGTTGQPVAIFTDKEEFAEGDYSLRVLEQGLVDENFVNVKGVAATATQKDLAKSAGICCVERCEINLKD